MTMVEFLCILSILLALVSALTGVYTVFNMKAAWSRPFKEIGYMSGLTVVICLTAFTTNVSIAHFALMLIWFFLGDQYGLPVGLDIAFVLLHISFSIIIIIFHVLTHFGLKKNKGEVLRNMRFTHDS